MRASFGEVHHNKLQEPITILCHFSPLGLYCSLILQVMGSMARDLTFHGYGTCPLLMLHCAYALSFPVNNAQNETDLLVECLTS